MRSQTKTTFPETRANEKGAALITTVLLSFLLLAAGGTLILVTTMAGITARDSTTEMQAYYAAEAGIARNLEVLRGNLDSNPTGTRASFHNILCTPSLWTNTAGAAVNVTTDGSTKFQTVSIFDPDNKVYSPLDPADAYSTTKCADATYKPDRLRIRVLGTGPKKIGRAHV